MSVEAILSRLEGVKPSGADKWRARCPACGGRNATKLGVRDLGDGRILLHCFSGCSVEEVVAALDLDLADLFPPRAPAEHRRPRERRPFSARDVLRALRHELTVVHVLLGDLARGEPVTDRIRERCNLAQQRCAALVNELPE